MESNSANNFKEYHPRNIPAKFGLNWPSGLGAVDVDDARRTQGDPKKLALSMLCSGELKKKKKGLKVLKVALMVRPSYFGTDRWSSPLYMTILLLCNWDSFGK